MIELFKIYKPTIELSKHSNLLHGVAVTTLEEKFAKYVGAKYAVSANSESSIIYLLYKYLLGSPRVILPVCIPPVVPSHLMNTDEVEITLDRGGSPFEWVGREFLLSETGEARVIDSAQHISRDCYQTCEHRTSDNDIMLFSFYPTKPLGGLDGGMAVSDTPEVLEQLAECINYGMITDAEDSWNRRYTVGGYKMYMNSIQAEIVLRRLETLDMELAAIEDVRNQYLEKLDKFASKNSFTSKHLFRVAIEGDRDTFRDYLNKNGIASGVHYDPLPMLVDDIYMQSIEIDYDPETASTTDSTPCKYVSLPFHSQVSRSQTNQVIRAIERWIS